MKYREYDYDEPSFFGRLSQSAKDFLFGLLIGTAWAGAAFWALWEATK